MTNLELIAKLAGVSRGTVDRVLHNRGQVRPETEEKVQAVMQELDFQPNALGIFAIGAPGVPGGTVMASLGLITGILLFDGTGTALMLTIFALQDSFGTACNVTGDGALTLILTGYADRHKIAVAESTAEE